MAVQLRLLPVQKQVHPQRRGWLVVPVLLPDEPQREVLRFEEPWRGFQREPVSFGRNVLEHEQAYRYAEQVLVQDFPDENSPERLKFVLSI